MCVTVRGDGELSVSAQTTKPNAAAKIAPAPKAAAHPSAAATSKPKEWPDYAGSPEGTRYIDLKQITKANAGSS